MIRSAAYSYQTDRWADQDHYVEVWIEKDALIGVISKACQRADVPLLLLPRLHQPVRAVVRGPEADRQERAGHKPVVIHLGDHDPSGIDMTRDITDRFALFGARAQVKRIALTMDQVDAYQPPPNPAKLTDARATGYIARFGGSSWELDALDPATLDTLITSTSTSTATRPAGRPAPTRWRPSAPC